jgi:hypothetical protein
MKAPRRSKHKSLRAASFSNEKMRAMNGQRRHLLSTTPEIGAYTWNWSRVFSCSDSRDFDTEAAWAGRSEAVQDAVTERVFASFCAVLGRGVRR